MGAPHLIYKYKLFYAPKYDCHWADIHEAHNYRIIFCKINVYTEFHDNMTNGLVADMSKNDGRRWSAHDMLFYCFKKA